MSGGGAEAARRRPGRFTLASLFRCHRKHFNKRDKHSMLKVERTMKAALLIQRWYRQYVARMEVRRRYTWTIFQSLEYADEHAQLQLYNFYNALLLHIPNPLQSRSAVVANNVTSQDVPTSTKSEPEDGPESGPGSPVIDVGYKGPHLNSPLTIRDLQTLLDNFKLKKPHRLHARYVALVLRQAAKHLRRLPNINEASTTTAGQITIIGDLHGKLDDLLVVWHKNGLPSSENPYVFNGDFVDRGRHGIEVLVLLLVCSIVHPDGVFLNRGNHEDHVMNQRYGFIREVRSKYKQNADRLLRLIEIVYRWLPLATLINKKALVVHGGISDATELGWLKAVNRNKVFDVLWSDPQSGNGCQPNALRGAGTYFGPDVTEKFLNKHRLDMLIRSHECKPLGYEITHNNKVITIFSASNYYEMGSNKGAYLKLVGPELHTHFVQFSSASTSRGGGKALTFRQTVGLVEASAVRELVEQIKTHQNSLEAAFALLDPNNSGLISVGDWCHEMELATGLSLPWRLLRSKLASLDEKTGKVKYQETFEEKPSTEHQGRKSSGPSVGDTLYRNKRSLEAIFRIIDKDNSGYISMDEFSEACSILVKHLPAPAPLEEMLQLCRAMDMNKDGLVDLNEFLEAFRLVDANQRQLDPLADPEADDTDEAEDPT